MNRENDLICMVESIKESLTFIKVACRDCDTYHREDAVYDIERLIEEITKDQEEITKGQEKTDKVEAKDG